MTEKKEPAKKPKEKDRHLGKMLGVWMPIENHDALEVISHKESRKKAAIVMRAIAEYCKKRGHDWPAQDTFGYWID